MATSGHLCRLLDGLPALSLRGGRLMRYDAARLLLLVVCLVLARSCMHCVWVCGRSRGGRRIGMSRISSRVEAASCHGICPDLRLLLIGRSIRLGGVWAAVRT